MITKDQLLQIAPKAPVEKYAPFLSLLEKYQINTPKRVSAFISQLAHESAEFTRLTENLNYSSDGLAATWPNRFKGGDGKPNHKALQLHRKPEAIANCVYANRLGNGDESTGDGWKYRGRGLIQITGKENYAFCGKALGIDLTHKPELLENPQFALESACWFWESRKLNELADLGDFGTITRKINGGTHGLADRTKYYVKAKKVLGV